MPEIVTQLPRGFPRNGHRLYPWEDWFTDSRPREFTKGREFTTAPKTFRDTATSWARRNGHAVRSQVSGDTVIIQVTLGAGSRAAQA